MFQKVKQFFKDRAMKKQAIKEALANKKETLKFIKEMKELYNFVTWVNKQFRNRAGRKAFWRRIYAGENLVEKQIQRLLKAYQDRVKQIDEFIKPSKKEEKK
jgi:ATP-dependent helicase/DNAse subunit B